ncbi:MAG: hypothetical protein IJ790_00990 [Lachnospiraceae bacterium]|nr:hypothetical protein [Lachnospiraceae bacterium]
MSEIKDVMTAIDDPKYLKVIIALLIGILAVIIKAGLKLINKILVDMKKSDDGKWGLINNKIDDINIRLDEIDNKIELNNNSTVSLIYHQCLNEALKWKEKGYIDLGAKKYFESMWANYIKLGDGLGTEPIDIIKELEMKP